jgi:alpha-acetolactate decarboxylase
MASLGIGALVTISGERIGIDGIVFDLPSRSKAIVAVMDASRGPLFRTVHPDTLSEREAEGQDDRALRLLIRRTPGARNAAAAEGTTKRREGPGHTRGAAHRPTGR